MPRMEPASFPIVVALLAVLAYALTLCTLATLAARVKNARQRHDLILASSLRRQEYLRSVVEQNKTQ